MQLVVIEGLDLEVQENEFLTIVGPSGCGKSTLLRVLAGLEHPTAGEVLCNGQPIVGPGADRGMVFQEDALFPWLTVQDNVGYGLRCRGVPAARRREIAQLWIDRLGLGSFENAFPKELSGGMRKRVDLARVYANESHVMLMDEPFAALDAQTRERLQGELLLQWENERKTVVFVTHDLDEAAFLSSRVVVLGTRPARAIHVEEIDLPRPRTPELRLSEQFLVVKRGLWNWMAEANASAATQETGFGSSPIQPRRRQWRSWPWRRQVEQPLAGTETVGSGEQPALGAQ